MTAVFYLAWNYLRFHRWKSALLVGAVAVALAIPGGLWALAKQAERHLAARAGRTPLLVGSRGSALELTLNSLYFRAKPVPPMEYGEAKAITDSGLGAPIPLYVRFKSRQDLIVATTPEYFPFRGLTVAAGSQLTRLGDCVLGSRVAKRRGLKPGDSVVSSPEQAFDVAGISPLRMRVVGVLAPADSADDDAIFVTLRTAWVIEGIGHGHEDANKVHAPGADGGEYNEVTDANVDTFHFHGKTAEFPISAIIVVPADEKSATRLLGRYQAADNKYQMVEPARVMDDLLATVVTVRTIALTALAAVGVATLVLLGLVQALSLRLRKREMEILHHIGASKWRVGLLLASEGIGVLLLGGFLAVGLTLLMSEFGTAAVRYWLSQ